MRGKVKTIIESVQTNCDHDFVEFFDKVPHKELLYTFRVAKLAPSFTINIIMRAVKTQRVMYKIKLEGCSFLNNPIMNKALGSAYRKVLVNTTFKCPIQPRVYFMRSAAVTLLMPAFHPDGRYHLNARIKMSQSPSPFVMEIDWKYSIIHMK